MNLLLAFCLKRTESSLIWFSSPKKTDFSDYNIFIISQSSHLLFFLLCLCGLKGCVCQMMVVSLSRFVTLNEMKGAWWQWVGAGANCRIQQGKCSCLPRQTQTSWRKDRIMGVGRVSLIRMLKGQQTQVGNVAKRMLVLNHISVRIQKFLQGS